MNLFEALVLGIVQGLTEFLPISSTGHLYLGRHLFGLDEAGLFLDTMLHLGTLIAVMGIYRQEILAMIRQPFSRLTLLVTAGTIPTIVIGLLFQDFFENISKTGITIGWEFLATGAILWLSDRIKGAGWKEVEQISVFDAIVIGLFQGAAIMPALSRSGLTIAAALFRRIRAGAAAYFSFLLSIPSIAGAIVLQSGKLFSAGSEVVPLSSLLVGTGCSLLFGYLAVKWMIRLLQSGSLKGFAIYVWVLGAFILAAQGLGLF